jgi:hypothetical protein
MRKEIGEAARGGNDDSRARGETNRKLSDDYSRKILALLAPDQKAQLDSIIQKQGGRSGPGRERPPKSNQP